MALMCPKVHVVRGALNEAFPRKLQSLTALHQVQYNNYDDFLITSEFFFNVRY